MQTTRIFSYLILHSKNSAIELYNKKFQFLFDFIMHTSLIFTNL